MTRPEHLHLTDEQAYVACRADAVNRNPGFKKQRKNTVLPLDQKGRFRAPENEFTRETS